MSIAVNDIWVNESPIVVVDGEVLTFSVVYKLNIDSTGTMSIWENGTSDESVTMLSGSLSATGNVLTLKTITFTGYGGFTLIAEWSATVNGQTVIHKCEFIWSGDAGDQTLLGRQHILLEPAGGQIYTAPRKASKSARRREEGTGRNQGRQEDKKRGCEFDLPPDKASGLPFPGVNASSLQTDVAYNRVETGSRPRNPSLPHPISNANANRPRTCAYHVLQ